MVGTIERLLHLAHVVVCFRSPPKLTEARVRISIQLIFLTLAFLMQAAPAGASSTPESRAALSHFIDGCLIASETLSVGRIPTSDESAFKATLCSKSIEMALTVALQVERVPVHAGLAICAPPDATVNAVIAAIAESAKQDRDALMAFGRPREFVVGMLFHVYPCPA
jgi:hypothetical protein